MRTREFKGAFFVDIKGAYNCVNNRKLLIEMAKQFPGDGISLVLLSNFLKDSVLVLEGHKFTANSRVP